jgi:hypothetical protein
MAAPINRESASRGAHQLVWRSRPRITNSATGSRRGAQQLPPASERASENEDESSELGKTRASERDGIASAAALPKRMRLCQNPISSAGRPASQPVPCQERRPAACVASGRCKFGPSRSRSRSLLLFMVASLLLLLLLLPPPPLVVVRPPQSGRSSASGGLPALSRRCLAGGPLSRALSLGDCCVDQSSSRVGGMSECVCVAQAVNISLSARRPM